ncbi:LOW QUALITY PROTEIN: Hypothetical protein PHPALM_5878 [Phytophthora palmivora]|uniref:CCHC-type domain-containing protein n=1 Tax=Phytophthora palmivora TaxID=4796 RepID=A0A2P4YGB1_9STRA|nr:LOW QUALITY PROTEIN: Hypothetical protein PHPALM_5878 [Phytophthora palmivora]
MERMLETFKTNITPAQAMMLFAAPKDAKQHCMYLSTILEVRGGKVDYLVLNNIVQFAFAELRTVLMANTDQAEELAHFAQAWEVEPSKHKSLGREVVDTMSERSKESRRCYGCGDVGYLRAACTEPKRAGRKAADESDKVWVLDSGASMHLVNDASWHEDVEQCDDQCIQPKGEPLAISMKSLYCWVSLHPTGHERIYSCVQGLVTRRAKNGGQVAFDVELHQNVLVVSGTVKQGPRPPSDVVIAALNEQDNDPDMMTCNTQKITLVDLAKDPSSGIELADHKIVNCLTCAQSKVRQSGKDTGDHSLIHLIGGVICPDLKDSMTPRDRLNKRCMINFVGHKSNYSVG